MLLKVIAIVAFVGACQAAEHAYSSQSITRFDNGNNHHDEHMHKEHKEHEDKHDEHKSEHKVTHQTEHKIVHPVEHHAIVEPNGNIAQHHEHKENKPHHDLSLSGPKPEQNEHKVEHKVEHKIEHKIEHKVEPKTENKVEAKKENHEKKEEGEKKPEQDDKKNNLHTKINPVVEPQEVHATTAPIKVIPVARYVQKIADGHKTQEPATSYQHISRHDVPAPPPKDFTDHSGTSKYEFAYEVKDLHTGDRKYQHESHDGHAVKGVYSLHQGDGSVRTVEYAADKHAGFSAAVKQTTKHVEEKQHH